MIELIFFGLMLLMLLGVGVGMLTNHLSTKSEQRAEWNKGVCAASGQPWVPYNIGIGDDRGYTDGAGNFIIISTNVDK